MTVGSPTVEEVRDILIEETARVVGCAITAVDTGETFAFHGVDSAGAYEICSAVGAVLGRKVEPTVLFEFPTIESLASFLAGLTRPRLPASPAERSTARATGIESDEAVAIVGLGCRFPGASDPAAFFENLVTSVDAVGTPPASARREVMAGAVGGFIDDVEGFDAAFFRLSPREAEAMDPQQRILLEVSWEALEDAGVRPSALRGGQIGVFVGVSTNEYGTLMLAQGREPDAYSGTGNALSLAANRISFAFDLRGPSMAVDTACSSSLVAVHLACESLRRGESSVALVAGSNLVLTPVIGESMAAAGVLASGGRCRTFDASADGYVRGEGIGVVVLKPLSAALADGDRIYATVLGSATNQDGHSNGLMAPSLQAQVDLLSQAYAAAGVDPRRVRFVEAHGTGTQLGDAVELQALSRVLGTGRRLGDRCTVGSVKTNIGHLEAAAGIAGLIKTSLALYHRRLPPNLHFHDPNHTLASGSLRLEVLTECRSLPSSGDPVLAGVSSFGFGGTNAHAVLSSVPSTSTPSADSSASSGHLVLALSARGTRSLARLAERYAGRLLDLVDDGDLAGPRDLCARTTRDRERHDHRLAVAGPDVRELANRLSSFGRGRPSRDVLTGTVHRPGRRTLFVFPGQGPEWAPLDESILADPVVAAALGRSDEAMRDLGGPGILDGLRQRAIGRPAAWSQPALVAVQVALAERWIAFGVEPDAVIGHSLGEVAAAHIAGALVLEDALRVAWFRGRRIDDVTDGDGAMLAVDLAAGDLRGVVDRHDAEVWVAARNAPGRTVLGGRRHAVEAVRQRLEADGVTCSVLPAVAFASHTPLMSGPASGLAADLAGLGVRPLSRPMRSTSTGERVTGCGLDGSYWADNLRSTVEFEAALCAELDEGPAVVVEVGPHPTLVHAVSEQSVRRDGPTPIVVTARRGVALDTTTAEAVAGLFCAGVEVAWPPRPTRNRPAVSFPRYPWDRQAYWAVDGSENRRVPRRGAASALLDERLVVATDEPSTYRFRGVLDEVRRTQFADHVVHGAPMLPGTGLLEVVFEAVTLAGHADLVLEDVVFEAVVALTEDETELQVTVERTDGHHSVSVHSVGTDGCFVRHLRARLGAPAFEEACTVPADLPGAGEDLDAEGRTCSIYDDLRARGLEYGPRYRRLFALRSGPRRVSGTVRGHVVETDWIVDPAVLDAGLHAVAALGDLASQSDGWMPAACRRVVVHAAGIGRRDCRVHADLVAHLKRRIEVDVRLTGTADDTDPLVTLEGLSLVPLGAPDSLEDRLRSWLYELTWRPALAERAERELEGELLVIASPRSTDEQAAVASECGRRGLGVAFVDLHTVIDSARATGSRPEDDPLGVAALRVRAELDGRYRAGGSTVCAGVMLLLDDVEDLDGVATCHVLLAVAQGLASAGLPSTPTVTIVTAGAMAVERREPVVAAQAAVWGLAGSLVLELPDLVLRRLDLAVGDALADVVPLVVAEAFATTDDTQAALRSGLRYVRRLVRRSVRDLGGPARPALRTDGTYLVTGGTGGLGLLVAEWLAGHGVEQIVLFGRRTPSEDARARIEAMERRGTAVDVAQGDVSSASDVAKVVTELMAGSSSLRGVIHAAGALADASALSMTSDRLASVFAAKAAGARHLHEATVDLGLDLFICFSSAASVLGSPGQSNYAAANASIDALVHRRRAVGLPAMTINWGPWSDVGLAAERADELGHRRSPALVSMISPHEGLTILEHLVRARPTQIAVLPYDVGNIVQFYPSASGFGFFQELVATGDVVLTGADRAYARPDLAQPFVEPETEVERSIAAIWRVALAIDRVGVDDALFELGGDSVLAGQVLTRVNQTFGIGIEFGEALDLLTVRSLSELVEDRLLDCIETLDDAEVARLLGSDQ